MHKLSNAKWFVSDSVQPVYINLSGISRPQQTPHCCQHNRTALSLGEGK